MIDRNEFDANFQYFDKEAVAEIIDLFIREHPGRFETLQRNLEEKDFDRLFQNAHSLKGTLSNFMDPVSLELVREFERRAKERSEEGISELFSKVRTSTTELVQDLELIRKELNT
jgi:HPt (histidine-containing phosphotransfer) domain-containing protein